MFASCGNATLVPHRRPLHARVPLPYTSWTRQRCSHCRRRDGRIFEVFGRVPLFFYVIHIPLTHLIAVVYSYAAFGDATWLTSGPVIFWDTPLPGSPPSYGLGLGAIYAVWFGFLAALYPVRRWVGQRGRRW